MHISPIHSKFNLKLAAFLEFSESRYEPFSHGHHFMSDLPVPAEVHESSHVLLHIVIPQCCVTPVFVSSSARISAVRSQFPGRRLIYNGELLQNNRTVASYGMHSCESIVAIAAEDLSCPSRQWTVITRDSDSFNDMIRAVMNNEARGEIMRIRDLRAIRQETRPRTYRRWLRSFNGSSVEAKSPDPQGGTVVPVSPKTLCEDPLPSAW
jgi:hypothetical protein